jgi:hypothetical protein
MPLATLLIIKPIQEVLDSNMGLEIDYHDRKGFFRYSSILVHIDP